jgi:hypothetical protein
MSEEFKREIRYDVVKLKTGKKVNCVVVEEDWPEYEIVWKMLQDRMQGRPNELTASKQRYTELAKKLERERRTHVACAEREASYAARIKASQEQAPAVEAYLGGDELIHAQFLMAVNAGEHFFPHPIIQPELAELQRELFAARQAVLSEGIERDRLTKENAELRKLLEESRTPEDVQRDANRYCWLRDETIQDASAKPFAIAVAVLSKTKNEMGNLDIVEWAATWEEDADALIDAAMLAAAKNPKEPKQ